MVDDRARSDFEATIDGFRSDITMGGSTAVWDARVRAMYNTEITKIAEQLRDAAETGKMTWSEAADKAKSLRNDTMSIVRRRSSPIGQAIAENIKAEGRTLNELIAKYTVKRFGANAIFDSLSAEQQNAVYGEVIAAAGRADPIVNAAVSRASWFGRRIIILSVAISVYNVATSNDPVNTAEREVATTGAGILGGAAGGALAGLACGPGAPVCVTIGAFVGGGLAAFGVSLYW